MGRLAEAPAAGASGSPETHGPLVPLLLALTAVTGVVDAFSYLVLGHVFVANMTGNVVFVAFALAGAKGFSLASSLLALGAFLVGAFVGGRLARPLAMHRGRLVTGAASIEVALTAGALVVNFVLGHRGGGAGQFLLIGLLGSAMGVQNAAARKLAVPDLTTTVLTLTITGIAADRLVGTASRRSSEPAGVGGCGDVHRGPGRRDPGAARRRSDRPGPGAFPASGGRRRCRACSREASPPGSEPTDEPSREPQPPDTAGATNTSEPSLS